MKNLARYALFVFIVLIVSSDVARADHITFTGQTQGAFDGGPFSSIASIPGLTFTGTSFALHTDVFGRPFANGPLSVLGNFVVTDATALFSSCSSDVCFRDFQLLVAFDSSVSPNPIIVQARLAIRPSNHVVGMDFSALRSIYDFSFTQGEFSGTGGFGTGANNIRGFPEDGIVFGNVFFRSLDPPHPTPEPTTMLLFGSAGVGLMLLRRYRAGRIQR